MFALDVIVVHFLEWEDLVAVLARILEFHTLAVHLHKMSPILQYALRQNATVRQKEVMGRGKMIEK